MFSEFYNCRPVPPSLIMLESRINRCFGSEEWRTKPCISAIHPRASPWLKQPCKCHMCWVSGRYSELVSPLLLMYNHITNNHSSDYRECHGTKTTKKLSYTLAGTAQCVGRHPTKPKVASWFPVTAHAWAVGLVHSWGERKRQLMFLSLSFSLLSFL